MEKHKEATSSPALSLARSRAACSSTSVNVFLPASQVDIRRPRTSPDYINKTIECKILKNDEARRNIVRLPPQAARRPARGDEEEVARRDRVGPDPQGRRQEHRRVRRIRGLGGIDGLLHITDMSWGRISNRTRWFTSISRSRSTSSMWTRTRKRSRCRSSTSRQPWANVADKYPVNSRHKGEVVNVMSYGAFVKLDPGIEGLVHISEMSWTRRINHPSELVAIGDAIEVQVLNINREKQEISLGMKQGHAQPWDKVAERYPPNTNVTGVVRNLTNYGAFIEIEEGIDGLLHVSDMSHVRKVGASVGDGQQGDKVTCMVLNVDQERKRIALGHKQMTSGPVGTDIPSRYKPGEVKKGKVTKLTTSAVFVNSNRPGRFGFTSVNWRPQGRESRGHRQGRR